jgi:hypothetical protein
MKKVYALILMLTACSNGFSQSWNSAPYCTPTVGAWALPCAQPAPSNDPNNFINDFVNSFTTTGAVTNINNMNSGCNGLPNNYIFYCNHPLVVTAGQTLTLSVQSASVWAGGFAIFIDWNQDNTFQVPSEKVGFTPSTIPGGAWGSMTVTVPPTQPNGVYRMRVREIWATTGNFIQPCAQGTGYGETEDYNVYIGTVPPPPSVVSATASPNQTVCLGQNANLSVSYTGTTSTTFDWGGPNSFTSAIQNPTVVNTTTASNGFYYVSLGTSTCPVMALTHVYVNQGPPISISTSNSVICNGSSVTLFVSGANNYTWMPGSSTNTSIVVSPSTTTIYSVTGTATNNACIGNKTYTLTVDQGPPVNISSSNSVICSGSSVTLTASGSNNYTWSPSASTNTTIVVTPTITTIYTVASTATNACVGTKMFTLTVNTCAGLNEWNAVNGVGYIYPNPFNDKLEIKTSGLLEIKITDALGQIVLERSVIADEIIDVSKLSKGIYCLFISNGTGISAIKIVKD